MIPKITVPDSLHAGIVARALVDHARKLISAANDPKQDLVERQTLVRTARITLELADELLTDVPNMPVEFPETFDAQLLIWLQGQS